MRYFFFILQFLFVMFFSATDCFAQEKVATNDYSVAYLFPGTANLGDTVYPVVVIKNQADAYASNSITLEVTITDEAGNVVYDEQKSGTYSLASYAYANLVFPMWIAQNQGNYVLSAVMTISDDVSSNNSLSQDLIIKQYTYVQGQMYGMVINDDSDLKGHLVRIDLSDQYLPKTDLGVPDIAVNITAGDYFDGVINIIDQDTKKLYYMDGDGSLTYRGTIRGLEGTITGLTSDGKEIFAVTSVYEDISGTYTAKFYQIDTAKFLATAVSDKDNVMILGLAAQEGGSIYAIDIFYNKLYTISKTGGAFFEEATLSRDIGYVQDFSFDRSTGVLYGADVEISGVTITGMNAVKVDLNDGTIDNVGQGTLDVQLAFCAITPGVVEGIAAADDVGDNITLYPNPANDIVYISGAAGSVVYITDMSGKVLKSQKISFDNQPIDLSGLSKGVYLIRTDQSNGSLVKKIILK